LSRISSPYDKGAVSACLFHLFFLGRLNSPPPLMFLEPPVQCSHPLSFTFLTTKTPRPTLRTPSSPTTLPLRCQTVRFPAPRLQTNIQKDLPHEKVPILGDAHFSRFFTTLTRILPLLWSTLLSWPDALAPPWYS